MTDDGGGGGESKMSVQCSVYCLHNSVLDDHMVE